MQIIRSISEWKNIRCQIGDQHLGFVPTMGNLHAGHESLLLRSKQENKITVLSIFVNSTQFDQAEDFEKYPRTLDQDINLAQQCEIDYILIPEYQALYPDQFKYRIQEIEQSLVLCGAHRPGHFTGVLTIVLKFLNLIKPYAVYFGEKDYQQLELVRAMCQAFFIDTKIIACPIVRDSNGLALSSRNKRLSPEQYQQALLFPKLLHSNLNTEEIKYLLEQQGFIVDYIEENKGRRFGAVKIGNIRLIDNVLLNSIRECSLC